MMMNSQRALEEPLLQHGHRCNDPGFPAGGQLMQLHVACDEGGSEFCVCSGSSAATANVVCYVVNLRKDDI